MSSKAQRTEWQAVALDMAIETSSMEILNRKGGFRKIPLVRVVFRTESGRIFSGPRISKPLRAELEKLAGDGPWLKPKGKRRR